MRKYFLLFLLGTFSAFSQPSPWGTGSVFNQSLDSLEADYIITSHVGISLNLNNFLNNYDYNIHIPPNYNGNEAFGLITFINAANNGNLINSWLPVLAEKKLILVAGNNIGNSVAVDTRIGVVLAACKSLQETLNIDSTRIYSSGASGGGRSASHLLFCFPEIFGGMIPNCGANYLRQVDQDYETQNPNSHYEYIFPYTNAQFDYVKSFKPILAYLTAYDDFREGDLMNIYHNGAEPDGFEAKILEISGSHCNTSTEHFRDGLNFLEHPFREVLKDSFAISGPITGNGFKLLNSSILNDNLVLDPDLKARAYTRNPLQWNDPKGAIIRASFRLDSLSFAENCILNMGFYDLVDTSLFNQSIGDSLLATTPGFLINYQFDSVAPKVSVLISSPSKGYQSDTIFSGRFIDFNANTKQAIKLHLWQDEWRIEFSQHFDPNSVQGINAVKLLDDHRSLRIRPSSNTLWDTSYYHLGTLISLYSERIKPNLNSSTVAFDYFQMISADTSTSAPLGIANPIDHNRNYNLYPNPNNGFFYLSSLDADPLNFSIINSQGKLCAKHLHAAKKSQLDLRHLPQGLYYLRSEQGNVQIKFIIAP
tara:strand:+ start:31442 stop:33220 length:1779 start_codon:yes stop_codon:yes gene_type:complete